MKPSKTRLIKTFEGYLDIYYEEIKKDDFLSNEVRNSNHFKCDQFEGLIKLFKDKGVI